MHARTLPPPPVPVATGPGEGVAQPLPGGGCQAAGGAYIKVRPYHLSVMTSQPTRRPVLPGEATPPPALSHGEAAPTLPRLRADAAAGRPVSLAALARALKSDPLEGQPWDPGTPEARARVALQGERVATLWPIAQAVRGAGLPLPGSWASDGPVMAGERTYREALASLTPEAIRAAAAALAALPPVTVAQDRALELCRGWAVPVA
jgi:hypothetical protein